jgi:hypothetical protein
MIAQYLLVVGAKSSLLFIGALLITLSMPRRAAAARHLVWIGAIVAAALLPVMGAFAPSWNVPVVSHARATASSLARAADDEHPVAVAPYAAPHHDVSREIRDRMNLPVQIGDTIRATTNAVVASRLREVDPALHSTIVPLGPGRAALLIAIDGR